MAKNNTLQEVKDRMDKLKKTKAAQLAEIKQKHVDACAQITEATKAMQKAMQELNVEAYEAAKKTKHKAQTAAEMYSGRYDQLEKQEYISEKESDEVIDSLLQYEVQLELDFKKALADPLKKLAKIHADYMDAVEDTERTLTAWQQEIHANYNTRGAMARKDPQTGKITNRSERPVPVHQLPYNGCDEAAHLGLYLVKAAPLMN